MKNLTLFEYFISIPLLTISILYCVSISYLIYISNQKKNKICINTNQLLMLVSFLYFILAGHLVYILYSQKNKKIYSPKISQELFLKIYLKTYYKKVPDEVENIIAKTINDLSQKYHVDFNLVVGIIGVESSFDPYATSKVGARGLMQVRYSVWKNHLKIPDVMTLHNIHEGIEYGILAFLQCKKEAKGNLKLALQKYNGTKESKYVNKVNREVNRFILLKQDKGELINGLQLDQRISGTNTRTTE